MVVYDRRSAVEGVKGGPDKEKDRRRTGEGSRTEGGGWMDATSIRWRELPMLWGGGICITGRGARRREELRGASPWSGGCGARHRSRRRALPGGGEAYHRDLGEARGQKVGEARRVDGRWKGAARRREVEGVARRRELEGAARRRELEGAVMGQGVAGRRGEYTPEIGRLDLVSAPVGSGSLMRQLGGFVVLMFGRSRMSFEVAD
ncbi:hypothetical protein VPH35_059239 [Triticum aestivum]